MVSANYNSNDLLIEKIDSLIKSNDQIFSEFNVSLHNLDNNSELLSKVLNHNSLIDYDASLKNKDTLNVLQKIRFNIFYIKNQDLLKILDCNNETEKSNLKHEFLEIATSSNSLMNKLKLFNTQFNDKIQENSLLVGDNDIHLSNDFINFIKNIPNFQYEVLSILNYILDRTEIVKSKFDNLKLTNKSVESINDFQKDLSLLIKEYSNDIKSLTNKFEKDYKRFELDYDKISKSANLLNEGVDSGLKNLADLNTKIQKVELEFSKLLNSQNNFIKAELDKVRLKLLNDVELIIQDVKEKSESITVQQIDIKNSHNDFIKLVEKAGIYELTQNYKSKADEEKVEYKTFRKYTTWSILAAVAFTLAVFMFAFFENSGNSGSPDYLILISRLSISAMFFILALYLSKQAAKHYESYQENHRTFLQLAALEPFMARMSEDEQKEIRKGLIPSYFNQNSDGKFAAKNDEVDMSMMLNFMDKLSNFSQHKKDTKVVESTAVETKPQS